MKSLWWVVALAFACNKTTQEAAPDAAEAGAATESKKVDLKDLETEFTEIVKTKQQGGDNAKRRDLCLELEPKVAARVEAHPTDAKLQQFVSQLDSFCPEAIESRKLMKKAAEPRPALPELSGAMKSMYTAASLKTDLKKAKQVAKKKGDPKEVCARIGITTRVVGEQKKQNKKTKKLLKEAVSFCDGPAVVATVKFHLREAAKAEKDDRAADLSSHCTGALSTLMDVKAANQKTQLEQSMKSLCREAYALKPMLDSRG